MHRNRFNADRYVVTEKDLKIVPKQFNLFQGTLEGNRELFVNRVKELGLTQGFRLRLPYCDRLDCSGKL